MGIESFPLMFMLPSVVKLLQPGDLAPREHGKRLILIGATSLGIWVVTILSVWYGSIMLGGWLSTPPTPETVPGIGPADRGPPAGQGPAEHDDNDQPPFVTGLVTRMLLVLFLTLLLAVVCWGGYSSLAISAGLFEVLLDVPFRDVTTWFDQLAWPAKVAAFPVLLAGMFAILILPFVMLGAASWLFGF